jgi:hypothetical protein
MRYWYARVFGPGTTQPSHDRSWLSTGENGREYRAAAKEIIRLYGWNKRENVRINDISRPARKVICEHCLRRTYVLCLRPGIVSRNKEGDLVCAKCHPLVAMALMSELVLGESS